MCLFVLFCLFVSSFCPTREFFTHLETSPLPVKGCKFLPYARYLWPLSMRVLFSMPHLLWHGASVYNGHLRGPVTLTPIAERLAVEFLWLKSVEAGIRRQLSACGANTLTHCAIAAAMKCEVFTRVKKFWPDVGEYFKLLYILTSYRTQFIILATNTVQIVNRHPPFGNQLRDMVTGLPKYELTIEQVSLFH